MKILLYLEHQLTLQPPYKSFVMLDYLQEIFSTLRQNKLRALMTGFSVAWGIFMLIILLGSGKGLQNGMEFNFKGSAKNAIWVWSGKTSKSYEGLKAGRRIRFTNADYEMLEKHLAGVDNISGRMFLYDDAALSYKKEFGVYRVSCINPSFKKISMMDIIEGRFVNDIDIKRFRKSVVISSSVKEILFKEEDALGKWMKVGGIPFKVVGVIEGVTDREQKFVYLPLSTAQKVFNGGNRIRNLAISTTASTVEENKQIEDNLRALLSRKHRFDVEDDNAIYVNNTLENFKQTMSIATGIRGFVWFIGIMTIIAGIVGVSNIMIILVKERTKEIGIRKAIGASPFSVIRLVLSESIFITVISGFVGMIFGIGLLVLASKILNQVKVDNPDIQRIFFNPSADFSVALWAVVILVVAGIVAGYIPSRRAASIKPIEALHDE